MRGMRCKQEPMEMRENTRTLFDSWHGRFRGVERGVTECCTGGMCAASAMSGIAAFSRLNVCDEMRRRCMRYQYERNVCGDGWFDRCSRRTSIESWERG